MAIALILEDLRDLLVAADIGLASGENLFLSQWPKMPQAATMLRSTGGRVVDHTAIDRDGNDHVSAIHEEYSVQVLSRAGHADKALTMQERVSKVLTGRFNFTMGSFYVHGISQDAPPQLIEQGIREQRERPYIYSTTYEMMVRNDSTL